MRELGPWLTSLSALACLSFGGCAAAPESTDISGWQAGTGGTGVTNAGMNEPAMGGVVPTDSSASAAATGGTSGSLDAPDTTTMEPQQTSPGVMPEPPLPAAPDEVSPSTLPNNSFNELSNCGAPPEDASQEAVEAWMLVNETRLAAGAGCINMVPELVTSAQSHCDYRATNSLSLTCKGSSGHDQTMGCPGFTGTNVQAREIAAGYPRALAYTEVSLSYGNDPGRAIPGWIETVYHRIPILDPWTVDMGWGGGPDCDVIDFGRGRSTAPNDLIVVYPYDGQTDVPPSWSGLESPAPPTPEGGWPGSYPINVYAQQIRVAESVLTKDGSDTPLALTVLDAEEPGMSWLSPYFGNTVFLYGTAFEADTTYRVKVTGTYAAGELNLEWTFTTGSGRSGRFGF